VLFEGGRRLGAAGGGGRGSGMGGAGARWKSRGRGLGGRQWSGEAEAGADQAAREQGR
jgi:hypothetical protein